MLDSAFISVVVPISGIDVTLTADGFGDIDKIIELLDSRYEDYEVLLLDNGNACSTELFLNRVVNNHRGVRLIRLSQAVSFDHLCALGVDNAIGDYTVVFQLQHDPISVIPKLIDQCMAGADIVYGVAIGSRAHTGLRKYLSAAYHWYLQRYARISLPRNTTFLRCMNRKAVNYFRKILSKHSEAPIYVSGQYFKSASLMYDSNPAAVSSGSTSLKNTIERAISIVVANTTHPLRIARRIGVLVSFGMAAGFLILLASLIYTAQVFPVAMVVLFLLVNLLILITVQLVVGEYLLHTSRNAQADYINIVEYDRCSPTMLNANSLNILVETVLDE